MADIDVTMKLTAQGMDQVLGALKKIEAEANGIGKDGLGLSAFHDGLEGIKELLPAIGLGAAIVGFTELAKGALETAHEMGEMAQKTGATAEEISVFGYMADKTGVNLEQLEKGLVKFGVSLDKAFAGDAKAKEALTRLGVSISDLKGKDTGQALVLVADAFSKVESSSAKTRIAVDLFGKAGAELIPLLNELGQGGFEEAKKKAAEFGILLDKDLVEASDRFRQASINLKYEVKGLAVQLMSGLTPALAQTMENMSKATSGEGINGWEKLGEAIGWVIKKIGWAFDQAGQDVADTTLQVKIATEGVLAILRGMYHRSLSEMKAANDDAGKQLDALRADHDRRRKETEDRWFGDRPPPKEKEPGGKAGAAEDKNAEEKAKALREARLAAMKKEHQDELSELSQSLKQQMEIVDAAYSVNEISLEEYNALRLQILKEGYDAEISTLKDEAARLYDASHGPVKDEAESVKLLSEWGDATSKVRQKMADRDQAILMENYRQKKVVYDLDQKQEKERLDEVTKLMGDFGDAVADIEAGIAEESKNVGNAAFQNLYPGAALKGAVQGLKEYRDAAADVFTGVKDIVGGACKSMEDALVQFTTTGKVDFKSLVDSMIADLTRLLIRQQITGPLASSLQGIDWKGLFGSSGSGVGQGAAVDLAGGGFYGESHTGGIVGSEHSNWRRLNVRSVDDVRRYHSGGIVGDERVIVAKKGEGVFTPGQMAAMGGGDVNVTVINNAGADVSTQSSRGADGSKQIEIMVERAVSKSIAQGGTVDRTLQRVYGMNRVGR